MRTIRVQLLKRKPARELAITSSAGLGFTIVLCVAMLAASGGNGQSWPEGKTYSLEGLTVAISAPVLVGRGKDAFNFPKIMRLPNGDLVATIEVTPESWDKERNTVLWSNDGGLTWGDAQACPIATSARVLLPSGDLVLLPYRLYPRPDGMGGPYCLIPKGKREVRYVKDAITVTGWPRRPITSMEQLKHGQASFVFDGQTVTLKDGKYLVTLNGFLEQPGSKNGAFAVWGLRVKTSVVAAESGDGLHWKIRSVIADEHWRLAGAEGPNEASLCRLKDGRLLCVFRSYGWALDYGQTYSSDEGRTWAEPTYAEYAWSVDPRLAVIPDGTVVLSGGRPGVLMWFSANGTGKDWQLIDLVDHHNAFHPDEALRRYSSSPGGSFYARSGGSTGYTEVVAVDDAHVLCVYDRSPEGKMVRQASEKQVEDVGENWSVWVVRATLTRK